VQQQFTIILLPPRKFQLISNLNVGNYGIHPADAYLFKIVDC